MIGIVILNYMSWKLTVDCIKSIQHTMEQSSYRIYVIDNSPVSCKQEILENIDMASSEIRYHQVENHGYSAGNNVGIQEALDDQCEYILVTNNDIIFDTKAISNLKTYLDEHQDVGIVGPKVYLPDRTIQEINMVVKTTLKGKYLYLLRKTPFRFLSKKYVEAFSYQKQDISESFDVHSVSGCCFMMSRECAEKVTPFDETTFLYEEEVILGVLMERQKLKTVYVADAKLTHYKGMSNKTIGDKSYMYLVESEMYYCRKYLGSTLLRLLPLYMIRSGIFFKRAITNAGYRAIRSEYINRTMKQLRGEN